MATATFAAGCFWGVETAFRRIPGVLDVSVGYSGGHRPQPTYNDVCSGETGHAEVARVEFDPDRVSFRTLVETFFAIHDPTQLNRQGWDVGTQYRSAIFTHDDDQARVAQEVKAELTEAGTFRRPIVTLIEPAREFWRAEDYHQRYEEKHAH